MQAISHRTDPRSMAVRCCSRSGAIVRVGTGKGRLTGGNPPLPFGIRNLPWSTSTIWRKEGELRQSYCRPLRRPGLRITGPRSSRSRLRHRPTGRARATTIVDDDSADRRGHPLVNAGEADGETVKLTPTPTCPSTLAVSGSGPTASSRPGAERRIIARPLAA